MRGIYLKKSKYSCFLGMISLVLIFSLTSALWGKQAQITDIIVTNNQDQLLVYFNTKGCFTPEMNKAIMSGIPTTFTFFLEIFKPRNFWPNKKLSAVRLHHAIKYDSLREEFNLTLSERGNQTFTVKEFSKAQEIMADVSNIQLIPLKQLERNNQYQLRIKAELNKVTLPLYLHYILFFVSLWDFETDWYVVEFNY
jgi:hypothetical protein